MKSELQIRVWARANNVIGVHLTGSLDSVTSAELEKVLGTLAGQNASGALVDLSNCDYISSAGVAVLFGFRKQITQRRGAVTFFNPQPHVRKVLEVVKALPLESIYATEEEADEYLNRVMAEELKRRKESGE